MTILQLIKDELKIDFTSTIVEFDSGTGHENPFELKARDFLRFAKTDFKSNNKKGNINALTNAKRAIDCQIDTAFTLFGIQYDSIPESSNKIIELTGLKSFDLPHKLKLIQALDFAPSGLISKTRTLRNKLEHYYKNPEEEEVKDAIELAELFVLSIESHIKIIEDSFSITDKKKHNESPYINNCIKVDFDYEEKNISLAFYKERDKIETIMLNQNDETFYALVKIINNMHEEIEMEDSIKIFLKIIEHPIPEKNIRVELI
jgi:hypothetical protein